MCFPNNKQNDFRFWSVEHLKDTEVDPQSKPEKFRKNEKMSQSGVGHGRQEFFLDFDKDFAVPSVDTNSDSTSDEDSDYADEEDDTESDSSKDVENKT